MMAALSPTAQDRLFLLGLGVGACALVGAMRQLLIYYRDQAALPPAENKPQYITQEVEDSLKISTLSKLLDSSNYSIQETTSIIICERALHDSTSVDAILHRVTQPDYDTRESGIRTLTYILNSSTIHLLNKPATYAALVTSLEYSLADYKHNPYDKEWDNWQLRDAIEQECLIILAQLVCKFGVENLIKVRFVERFLAKEPWGKDDQERQNKFCESLHTRHQLSELILPLVWDSKGRNQLCASKLLPLDYEWEQPSPRDVRMTNGEGTAGEEFHVEIEISGHLPARRRRDQSSEEDSIRRRNREAMVLNDGTRPFGRDDIIQRASTT
ncbi:hypothetical protein BJ875DRAFT_225557 [Amylocarpus encephaloides]|uniref:Cytoskeleton-associated protein n=1 Tax=Amylocarpus encephaloides TaxID=45428 RepID=A0A9P7YNU5_9HELO|nr:hypothetical protein BJ875DRAFT_225557 [Amylocarpus encephaloides]